MTGGGGDRRSPPRGGVGEGLGVETVRRGLPVGEVLEGAGVSQGFYLGGGAAVTSDGGLLRGVTLGPAYGALGVGRQGADGRTSSSAAEAGLAEAVHGRQAAAVTQKGGLLVAGPSLHGTVHVGREVGRDVLMQEEDSQDGAVAGDGRGEVSIQRPDTLMDGDPVRSEFPALSGRFTMGGMRPNEGSSPVCASGVRRNASVWNQPWSSPNLNSGVDGAARAGWGRPAVVPLPSPAELGEIRGGPDRVILDSEEVNSTLQKFETALVGRTFGKRIPFAYLNKELQRRWQGFGPFRLVTVGPDSFICFFNTVEGRNAVLMGGPWVVAGQVIGVDRWSPDFSPASKAGFITPIWVRFAELPFYCWGGRSLARIAGRLGEPIWMDAATDRLERGQFARVCIRMDLSQVLKPGIWVDGPFGSFYQKITYEGLPSFCFQCGHVDHKSLQCTAGGGAATVVDKVTKEAGCELQQSGQPVELVVSNDQEGQPLAHEGVDNVETNSVECPGLGPWMVVQRQKAQSKGTKGRGVPGFGNQVRGSAGGGPGKLPKGMPKAGRLAPDPGGSRPNWESNIKAMNSIVEYEQASQPHLLPGTVPGMGLDVEVFSGFKAMPSRGKEGTSMELTVFGSGGHERAAYKSRDKKRKHVIHHDGGVASSLVRI